MLRGSGPDGRAWTAIASPYWPAFADEWALTCGFCAPCEDELIPVASHLHGFGIAPGAGEAICNLIQNKSTIDLNAFRLDRFYDGSPITADAHI